MRVIKDTPSASPAVHDAFSAANVSNDVVS